jgi:hypothetical protein
MDADFHHLAKTGTMDDLLFIFTRVKNARLRAIFTDCVAVSKAVIKSHWLDAVQYHAVMIEKGSADMGKARPKRERPSWVHWSRCDHETHIRNSAGSRLHGSLVNAIVEYVLAGNTCSYDDCVDFP